MTNVCVRCGKDRDVFGEGWLAGATKTYKICMICRNAWMRWVNKEVYEFMAASPELDGFV